MSYTNTKTPIVYYGGKTAIWNHIEPLIPCKFNHFLETDVYSEVFLGGGTPPSKIGTAEDRSPRVELRHQLHTPALTFFP